MTTALSKQSARIEDYLLQWVGTNPRIAGLAAALASTGARYHRIVEQYCGGEVANVERRMALIESDLNTLVQKLPEPTMADDLRGYWRLEFGHDPRGPVVTLVAAAEGQIEREPEWEIVIA